MLPKELSLPMPWGSIAAKAWGSPNHTRVLMVHGILDNSGAFDRLIELLPGGYYFVCIDLPGHGLSSHFPAGIPLDYFTYVLAIRRVLDHLKWDTCLYIGHSLGGNIGLMFSSIYPERVKRILCLDSIPAAPIPDSLLVSRIRRVHDNVLSTRAEMEPKLYTYDEVIHMLMNLRISTLNVGAAEALIKRSVTKVGHKYKFNRDRRLNIGVMPLLNCEQHIAILKQLQVSVSIVFSSATLQCIRSDEARRILLEITQNEKHCVVSVQGNHDVHNNHPERVAPHVCRFLTSLKSSL